MDLEFNHKTGISEHDLKACRDIVNYLLNKKHKQWVPGKDIANHFNVLPIDIRKHIQIIREYNEEFLSEHYIIASRKGYKLTNNKEEIKKYAKALHTRSVSALAQVDQAYKITKKGW